MNAVQKPKFISIESEKVYWDKLLEEFSILQQLGYSKFKIIDQSKIAQQQCPYPSRQGDYIDHRFEDGSSGLFGNELPQDWLSAGEAIKMYEKIFLRYKYFGDDGVFNNKWIMQNRYLNKLRNIFKLKYPHVGWYDTHAAL